MQAVILAGGKGSRLKPFTVPLPKPLMPLGEIPILEVIIRQLKRDGFDDLIISVGYLKELIMAFLGNKEKRNFKISYSVEKKPLGTAGPLTLIDSLEDDFLVINGDTLTTIDYKKLFEFHLKNNACATISTFKREVKIDFGVIKTDDRGLLNEYIEKPVYSFEVSMGVNVFNRKTLKCLAKNEYQDLPQMIMRLKDNGEKVQCYLFDGYWLDIGRINDYETANLIFEEKKNEFLRGCI
jgi:NDP-sugar pyrophosphorylase family protein